MRSVYMNCIIAYTTPSVFCNNGSVNYLCFVLCYFFECVNGTNVHIETM